MCDFWAVSSLRWEDWIFFLVSIPYSFNSWELLATLHIDLVFDKSFLFWKHEPEERKNCLIWILPEEQCSPMLQDKLVLDWLPVGTARPWWSPKGVFPQKSSRGTFARVDFHSYGLMLWCYHTLNMVRLFTYVSHSFRPFIFLERAKKLQS